jgi:beta-fructofuranosidase
MLRLPGAWTWDFWLADDGERHHLFFLFASRALRDQHRRHRRAGIGHAVSDDLRNWFQVADALASADAPAFDDLATWTGCVVREPAGRWRMFYTGTSEAGGANIQTIGAATSADLEVWDKDPASPLVTADSRWYEKIADGTWREEAWRDPWVFPDPGGNGWHMLITARANHGPADERGVIGHATSADLRRWEVQPPLSKPGAGFNQLEVAQVASVDGRLVLLFSAVSADLSHARQDDGESGGIWWLPIASPTGPFDIVKARRLTDESLYCGKVAHDRSGQPVLLAFRHRGPGEEFVGELADPMPIGWENGELQITKGAHTG